MYSLALINLFLVTLSIPLSLALPTIPPSSISFLSRFNPTFLSRINDAVTIVKSRDHSAVLSTVSATHPDNLGVTSPASLTRLVVTFGLSLYHTAYITSTLPGLWGEIALATETWSPDEAVPLPVPMDITEADALIKKNGFGGAYDQVFLQQGTLEEMGQTFYVFEMVDRQAVWVNVDDKKVSERQSKKAGLPFLKDVN
ncbi:hypothetical protein MMC12_001017 [Toensbergia leucococca]|nr:hypothetical protein [Toensbergia leucococca]